MTLAVVDDDPDVRIALNRLLRGMGHHVRLFASAEEFVGDHHDFDCLILDIRLPGMNGLELREQMRTAGCDVPVVLITGDRDQFLGNNLPTDVPTLRKPFDEDSFVAAISNAVGGFVQASR